MQIWQRLHFHITIETLDLMNITGMKLVRSIGKRITPVNYQLTCSDIMHRMLEELLVRPLRFYMAF